jgi:DHA2 family multidrug resistance protein
LPPSSPWLRSAIQQTTAYLQSHGYSHADALSGAYARYYAQFQAQTRMLSFMDCFHVLGIMTLVAAPLVLLTKSFKVGGQAPEGH